MPSSPRPPHGICLPVTYIRARDGDTVEVSVSGGAIVWAIRLNRINCPEKREVGGFEATDFTQKLCVEADELSVFIACPRRLNVLRELSFDRIPGDIYVDDKGWLTDLLVSAGHAKRV